MSKPRPELRRNKSSRVGDSNFHLFVITRRTPKHKKDWSVLLCIQDQSVTKHSTKLNQQINSYCLSRERLLIYPLQKVEFLIKWITHIEWHFALGEVIFYLK